MANSKNIKTGDTVEWNYGSGSKPSGKVKSVTSTRKSIRSKGSTINRNGDQQNPAVEIEQKNGTKVLKKSSELHKKTAK